MEIYRIFTKNRIHRYHSEEHEFKYDVELHNFGKETKMLYTLIFYLFASSQNSKPRALLHSISLRINTGNIDGCWFLITYTKAQAPCVAWAFAL